MCYSPLLSLQRKGVMSIYKLMHAVVDANVSVTSFLHTEK